MSIVTQAFNLSANLSKLPWVGVGTCAATSLGTVAATWLSIKTGKYETPVLLGGFVATSLGGTLTIAQLGCLIHRRAGLLGALPVIAAPLFAVGVREGEGKTNLVSMWGLVGLSVVSLGAGSGQAILTASRSFGAKGGHRRGSHERCNVCSLLFLWPLGRRQGLVRPKNRCVAGSTLGI